MHDYIVDIYINIGGEEGGGVAHMVERPLCMRKVLGSMPSVSRRSYSVTVSLGVLIPATWVRLPVKPLE